MKKILLIAAVIAFAVTAGIWLVQGDDADTAMNPPEGAPGHKHERVQKIGEAGKIYYTCAMHPQVRLDQPGNCPICGMQLIEKAEAPAEKPVLYWYDPMRPDQHFDKPGKSPFMDMQLLPKYADGGMEDSAGIISIDPRMVQNLGIRTVRVERSALAQSLRASGTVMADETAIEVVQARAAGWVEKLRVRAVNEPVRRGQLLAEVYSPELYSAQQEFVLALHAQDAGLKQAARQRLALLGLAEQQIAQLEKSGVAQRRVSYYSPLNGIVTELGVREGAQLSPGMSLFSLVDLSRVWVVATVPETQAAALQSGSKVAVTVSALPGRQLEGRIDYIYPDVMRETRSLRLRAVVANPSLELKPGMYAEVLLAQGSAGATVLVVPSEALIRTGTRTAVIVAETAGRFRPVDVVVGAEAEGKTEILAGLDETQSVVASGQFLIDSEANLQGGLSRLGGSVPEHGSHVTPPAEGKQP